MQQLKSAFWEGMWWILIQWISATFSRIQNPTDSKLCSWQMQIGKDLYFYYYNVYNAWIFLVHHYNYCKSASVTNVFSYPPDFRFGKKSQNTSDLDANARLVMTTMIRRRVEHCWQAVIYRCTEEQLPQQTAKLPVGHVFPFLKILPNKCYKKKTTLT